MSLWLVGTNKDHPGAGMSSSPTPPHHMEEGRNSDPFGVLLTCGIWGRYWRDSQQGLPKRTLDKSDLQRIDYSAVVLLLLSSFHRLAEMRTFWSSKYTPFVLVPRGSRPLSKNSKSCDSKTWEFLLNFIYWPL